MELTFLERTTLGLSGLTALIIGTLILFVPHAFYASYGISLGDSASLLNELRAPGAGLAAFGALMLLGIRHRALMPAAMTSALAVFLAFPAGRVVGLVLDGMPSNSVIGALLIEVAIAALCLVAFRRRLRQTALGFPAAQPAR